MHFNVVYFFCDLVIIFLFYLLHVNIFLFRDRNKSVQITLKNHLIGVYFFIKK